MTFLSTRSSRLDAHKLECRDDECFLAASPLCISFFSFSTRRSKSPPRRLPLFSSILCYHYCSYYYFLFLFFRNILHLLKIIILFFFFYLSFASSSLALLRSPLLLVRRFNTTIVAPDRNPGNIYGFVYFVLFLCQPRVYPSPEDKGGGSFAGLHAFMRDKIDG